MPRKISLLFCLSALALLLTAGPAQATKTSRMLAPGSVCKNQTNLSAPLAAQEQAMICMTNFARRTAGMGRFGGHEKLNHSAVRKGEDILRCNSFSHYACDRDFTYWLEALDYTDGCWAAGENLAWGTGDYGTVRSVFRAWMNSPGHKSNILSNNFSQIGIGLRVGSLEGHPDARVWVQHFGDRC